MNKRDLSVSMERANLGTLFISLPVVILQFFLFAYFHPNADQSITWNYFLFFLVVIAGIVVHELVHGVTWALAAGKPWSSISFGFQTRTLTPYCHVKEPIKINPYRIGAILPGIVVGILPFVYSLITGDPNWFWFSLIHTSGAGGDWLVLWLIRSVQPKALVEDHPTQAGCYVIEE